jgi:hypothetical protein
MANGSSRILPALVSVVVGFALGWLTHRQPAASKAGDHLIGVHSDGTVTQPEAVISNGNKVAWATSGGESLGILFPESGFPKGVTEPPFAGMTHQGTDWAVRCGNGICFSGSINPKLPGGNELRYKYDQVVADKRVDGWIIIQP